MATNTEQIAIVGVRLRVPGADTPDALWANLCAGRSSIEPLSAADLDAAGVDRRERRSPFYVARAGWIDGIENMDHGFFDYSFREAQHIDPQQRLLLLLSHELLEEVGPPTRHTGVFVSVGFPSYLVENLLPAGADAALASLGNSAHSAATRIAYKLNLAGPACAVECGCSSSLVALHLARISILTGQCEMALVGGCSLRIPPKQGYLYQQDGALSQDGMCRPFDERATGTVFTSGAVVTAVKKLSAALKDGDEIWCVVRGTAINNDGSAKAGFTAPSVTGQQELFRSVFARTGVSPRSVGYLEAHGTGTPLGDPIEFQALSEAFASETGERGFCSLGSIKANVGHLDVAAGLMGVVKAGLCLRRRSRPPLANFARVNRAIDLAASPFHIQTEVQSWETGFEGVRRAGVNSLGVGGTNAFALLEEAPPRRSGLSSRWGLVVTSVGKPAELEARGAALLAAARAAPEQVGDLAYSSQLCPPRFATRGAYYIDAGAADKLELQAFHAVDDWRRQGVVFAFPGQGNQYQGMGGELYAHVPEFREHFDIAAVLFRGAGAEDPRALLGADALALERTEVLQPYLFTLEHALGRLLLECGLQPAALLGHSLGEYVAATLAGVFDLETAVRLVAERARLIAAAPAGAMLVIQAPEEEARRHVREGVSLCVVNGAHNSVLGGSPAEIDALAGELELTGTKFIRLKTARAFHSHLMEDAAGGFARVFEGVMLNPPRIPIVSNLDGRRDDPLRFTRADYWVRHLREPVRFLDGLRTLVAEAAPVVLELGPGTSVAMNLLSSFPGRSAAVLPALAPGREREQFFGLVARLWLGGAPVDFRALHRARPGRLTPLPPHTLAPKRCWVEARRGADLAAPVAAGANALRKQVPISAWLYEPRWSPRPWRDPVAAPVPAGRELTLFSTARLSGEGLAAALESAGARVHILDVSDLLSPEAPEELAGLEREVSERLGQRPVERAVLLLSGDSDVVAPTAADAIRPLMLALAITKTLRADDGGELVLVGCQGVRTTTEPVHWWNGWLTGFVAVARQEASSLTPRYIDAEQRLFDEADSPALVPLARTVLDGEDPICALRGGLVWEREFRPVWRGAKQAVPRPLERVLILGGSGNVGLAYALHCVRAGASHLAIVSREAESIPARLVEGDVPARRIWARRRRLIGEAERAHLDLCFVNADATVPQELEDAVERAVQRFGGLDAIVHASGIPAELCFRAFFATDPQYLARLYQAKLEVAQHLDRIASRLQVPRILTISSISGVLGGLGHLGYATSHNLLDAYAASRNGKSCRWLNVAWDAWDFYKEDRGADAVDAGIDALAISEEEGLEVLRAIAGAGWPAQVIVSSADLPGRFQAWVLRSGGEARRIELGERPDLREEYLAPKDETQRRLVQLWGEALGIRTVGIRDNFFELGGDSLLALSLVERINAALEGDISVMDLFEYPTVEKLSHRFSGSPESASPDDPGQGPVPEDRRARARRGYFEARRKRLQGGP